MTSTRSRTTSNLLKTNRPRNEGRVFTAWNSGQYIFRVNPKGRLYLEPHRDRWLNFNSILRDYNRTVDSLPETELIPGGMRREEKAKRFREIYYAGQEIPKAWQNRMTPFEFSVTGRMTVHHPPIQFLPPED